MGVPWAEDIRDWLMHAVHVEYSLHSTPSRSPPSATRWKSVKNFCAVAHFAPLSGFYLIAVSRPGILSVITSPICRFAHCFSPSKWIGSLTYYCRPTVNEDVTKWCHVWCSISPEVLYLLNLAIEIPSQVED